MIKKPEWMIYAKQTQEAIDRMRPTKSGKRERDFSYRQWLTARNEKGYEGTFSDWECLLRTMP